MYICVFVSIHAHGCGFTCVCMYVHVDIEVKETSIWLFETTLLFRTIGINLAGKTASWTHCLHPTLIPQYQDYWYTLPLLDVLLGVLELNTSLDACVA